MVQQSTVVKLLRGAVGLGMLWAMAMIVYPPAAFGLFSNTCCIGAYILFGTLILFTVLGWGSSGSGGAAASSNPVFAALAQAAAQPPK